MAQFIPHGAISSFEIGFDFFIFMPETGLTPEIFYYSRAQAVSYWPLTESTHVNVICIASEDTVPAQLIITFSIIQQPNRKTI